jgi:small-conductance mechanosensitive channel
MLGVGSVHDAVLSLPLLACIVLTLLLTRGRGPLPRLLVECVLLLAIGAFLMWQGTSPLPHAGSVVIDRNRAWFRALAVIWWLIGARLAVNITVLARGLDARSRGARLFSDLAAAVIYVTTVLIILNSVLDLNVSSLLLTSGVIAIVLGLALQNTLADVFFGLAIGLEQPFHLGDRVSIGDSAEGIVVQMNWRSVRIHSDGDDLVTIPNSLVAKGQIVNRSMPTRHRSGTVEVIVPAVVSSEKVFEAIRHAILLCPTLLPEPAPAIALRRSGLHSSTYAASFFVADSPALGTAKSTLLRQIRRVFRYAGIGRPSPMSPVELLEYLVLFEELPREQLEGLADSLVMHVVEPEDAIFEQGTASSALYVIASGVMEICRHTSDTGETSLGRVGAGEYVGEIGLITGAPRAFTIRAVTHGKVLELPGESLAAMMRSSAPLKAALERSARRGLAMIERDDAARAVHPSDESLDAFARVRAFFGIRRQSDAVVASRSIQR